MTRQCRYIPGNRIYCSLYYRLKRESVKNCERKEVMRLEFGTEPG